jgi:hypothetical protein
MASASDYLEGELLNHIFRTSSFTKPTTLAIALCTAATSDSDDGSTITEVSNANGYARQTLNPLDANWTDASGGDGQTDNASAITFGPASGGNWGTITHVAIIDNSTYGSGNLLIHGALDSSVTINDGDSFSFAIGNLVITFS